MNLCTYPVRLLSLVLACAALCGLTGCRYVHADPKIAFMGDSLTAGWSFPSTNYGVRGDTTAQMIARYPASIPGKGYTTVVILGGTNDVLQHVDPAVTVRNLETMALDAEQKQHAQPILCEIPPIFHSYVLEDSHNYLPEVAALNQRIIELAAAHHWSLVDYYDPLLPHSSLLSDGVHMGTRGYLLMEEALLPKLPH